MHLLLATKDFILYSAHFGQRNILSFSGLGRRLISIVDTLGRELQRIVFRQDFSRCGSANATHDKVQVEGV